MPHLLQLQGTKNLLYDIGKLKIVGVMEYVGQGDGYSFAFNCLLIMDSIKIMQDVTY